MVEDDATFGRCVAGVLGELGWACEVATDAEAGLAALGRERWSAVLSDLQLPAGNGLAVVAAAAALIDPPRVLAMTGMVDSGFYLEVARRAGARAVLAKPFTATQLAAALAPPLGPTA